MEHITKYDLAKTGTPGSFAGDAAVITTGAIVPSALGLWAASKTGWRPTAQMAAVAVPEAIIALLAAKKAPRLALGMFTGAMGLAAMAAYSEGKAMVARIQAQNQPATQTTQIQGSQLGQAGSSDQLQSSNQTASSAGLGRAVPRPVRR